ncbi:MAG: DUF1569 domain-containing protein [Bacteroidota bacterium]|jgi:hypothetical protein
MNNNLNRFCEHLKKLQPDTKPMWGIMSPQHMIEHLILAVRVSNNKVKVECFNPPEKIPALKRFLLSERPLPKNFVNPLIGEGLIPLQFNSLEEAIANLNLEILDYYTFFAENSDALLINPTFGELNKDEWQLFHKKHFIHHLAQFGIIVDKEK